MEGFHLRNHLVWNHGYPGVVPGVPAVPQLGGPAPVLPQGLQLQLPEFGLGLSTAEVRRLNRATLGVPALPLPREGENAPRERVRCQHPGCDKQFAWPQDLSKHVRKYHSGEPPRFECPHDGCGKRFFERKLLVAHERTHTDERPFACPHPGCDKAFRARNALAYHVKALHADHEVLRCTECGFHTKKKDALAIHKERHKKKAAEKAWKEKAKDEVNCAVKTAKEDLKTKTAALLATRKALAKEKKARAKTLREIEKLEARVERLSKKRKGHRGNSEREPSPAGPPREPGVSGTSKKKQAKHTRDDGTDDVAVHSADEMRAETRETDGAADGDDDEDDSPTNATRARRLAPPPPEVVLLDAADGSKVPMLVCASEEEQTRGSTRVGAFPSTGREDARNTMRVAEGLGTRNRFLRPVCDQALPWSASFIGCPGIKHADEGPLAHFDFTKLFRKDGTRVSSNAHRTTPLEVSHPTDRKAFRARSTRCPWSSENARATFLAARDPAALRGILSACAPEKAVRVKRVDGQCGACYAAHVALMAAERRAEKSARGGE